MTPEEFTQAMAGQNLYRQVCAAERYFRETLFSRTEQESHAACYALIASARRVLATRQLIGMNVEQFQHSHPELYRDISRALAEAFTLQGFSYHPQSKLVTPE